MEKSLPTTDNNETSKLKNDTTPSAKTIQITIESPSATDTSETDNLSDGDSIDTIDSPRSAVDSPRSAIDSLRSAVDSPRSAFDATKTPPNSDAEPNCLADQPPLYRQDPNDFRIPSSIFGVLRRHYEHYKLFTRMISGEIPLAPNVGTRNQAELQASKRSHMINKEIDDLLTAVDKSDALYVRLLAMRAVMNYEDARLMYEEGQPELAKQILWTTMQRSVQHVLQPEMTYVILRIMNHMAYYMMQEGDYAAPKDLMEQAEKIYLTLNYLENAKQKPLVYYTEWELFSDSRQLQSTPEGYEKSERLVTNNIELLSHIYWREGDEAMYSISQHRVLNRQLYMKDGDPLAWINKCLGVGHFFIAKNLFSAARTHLGGATRIFEEYVEEFYPNATSIQEISAELAECYESIAKSWVLYSIALFTDSRDQILETYYEGVRHDNEQRDAFIRGHMTSTKTDDLVAKFQILFDQLNDEQSLKRLLQDGCGDEVIDKESDDSSADGQENRGQGEGAVNGDKVKREGEEVDGKEDGKDGEEVSVEEEVNPEREEGLDKVDGRYKEEDDKENDISGNNKDDLDGIIVTKEVREVKKEEHEKQGNKLRDGDIIVILKEDGVEVSMKGSQEDLETEEEKNEVPEAQENREESVDTLEADNDDDTNREEKVDEEENKENDTGSVEVVNEEEGEDDKESKSDTESVGLVDEEEEEDIGDEENDEEEEMRDGETAGAENRTEGDDLMEKLFQFKLLTMDEIFAAVPCKPIDNENDAHRLFNTAKGWLSRFTESHDVVNDRTEYINSVMDLSELYRLVSFFETDPGSRFYILRDRKHTLEIVMNLLREMKSPSFTHLGVELTRELTAVRMEMLELSRAGRSGKRFLQRKKAGMRYLHSRLVDTAATLGRDDVVTRFLKQDPFLVDGYTVPVGRVLPHPFQDK